MLQVQGQVYLEPKITFIVLKGFAGPQVGSKQHRRPSKCVTNESNLYIDTQVSDIHLSLSDIW